MKNGILTQTYDYPLSKYQKISFLSILDFGTSSFDTIYGNKFKKPSTLFWVWLLTFMSQFMTNNQDILVMRRVIDLPIIVGISAPLEL
jgi:hypothetical protein